MATDLRATSTRKDTFCMDSMPPRESWPAVRCFGDLSLQYPEKLNAAAELLDKAVSSGNGEKPALWYSGGCWTYRQLLEQANRIAGFLVDDLEIVPGNRVLLRAPNCPMLFACWFAVLKAGAVVVCTNPLLRKRELIEIHEKAKINLALADAAVAVECEQAIQGTRIQSKILQFNSTDRDSLDRRIAAKSSEFQNFDTKADEVAIIAFTSGTTGNSKGTLHTHADLLAVCDTFSRHILKPQTGDIFIGSPSIAFTYGLGGLLLFPMRAGASVALPEKGTPAGLLEGIQKYRASVCFTSPTGYRAMLKLIQDFDVSSLRKCVSAGEHLPAATFEAWRKGTGVKIIDGIGSTEMLHIFISTSEEAIRAGATGKVVPGYEARILDDQGSEALPNTLGRLAVRGPTGCRYLNSIEEQRKYVQGGWNVTGDLYRMDEDGYFWYESRSDDMIISSGYNVSAVEVENALLRHPKVAECAVVGTPDDERGQIVKAYVVLFAGAAGDALMGKELQDFVKAEIAPYKYPRAIEFVPSLPKNANGKLQRFRLRKNADQVERV